MLNTTSAGSLSVSCETDVFAYPYAQHPMNCDGNLTETELAIDEFVTRAVKLMGEEYPATQEQFVDLLEGFEDPLFELMASPSPHGERVHDRGLMTSKQFGLFLHLSFRGTDVRPFVPTVCRKQISGMSRRHRTHVATDGIPPVPTDHLPTDNDWRFYNRFYSAPFHVFRCTPNVFLRVYTFDRATGDSEEWFDAQRNKLPPGNMTELLIYRADGVDDVREHFRQTRRL